MKPNRFFLIGMPGCGKTTFGKKVAHKLGIEFIDLDDYIEEKEGLTIPEIFEQRGEEKFRTLESQYLQEIIKTFDEFVLSTGGGTPAFHGNMDAMNNGGTTIYLNIPIKELIPRIIADHTNERPLFAGLNSDQLQKKLLEMLNQRESYYRKAKITLLRSAIEDVDLGLI